MPRLSVAVEERMRIVVDAMGGDVGPAAVVPGAVAGARGAGVDLALVGRAAEIQPQLDRLDTAGVDVRVVEAPETIGMDEHPAQAVRRKPNSSIVVAAREVAEGRAAAMVSAGNSGAVMAAALAVLGRLPGVDRPALAAVIPSSRGGTLVLDLGAVTDPRPHHLVQFAAMGHVYAERVLGIPNPSLALLSNGEEPGKGNRLVQEVYPLLAAMPGIDFRGNVEGNDIPRGTADVVVTDGFTGNVALKAAEGVATLMTDLIRAELTASLPRKLAALALKPAFRAVAAKLDYGETGGAPLLGVKGPVVIAHGRSNAKALGNAVGVAERAAREDIAAAIVEAIAAASRSEATTEAGG